MRDLNFRMYWPMDGVMNDWRKMSTAPKDGSEFLIRYPLQGNVKELCNWDTTHHLWERKGSAIFPETQECEWISIEFLADVRVEAYKQAAKFLCDGCARGYELKDLKGSVMCHINAFGNIDSFCDAAKLWRGLDALRDKVAEMEKKVK